MSNTLGLRDALQSFLESAAKGHSYREDLPAFLSGWFQGHPDAELAALCQQVKALPSAARRELDGAAARRLRQLVGEAAIDSRAVRASEGVSVTVDPRCLTCEDSGRVRAAFDSAWKSCPGCAPSGGCAEVRP